MKLFWLLSLLLLPLTSQARFLLQYGLNYSSEKDASVVEEYDKARTFHKLLLGASVNANKTFFFGWNINSWTSSLKQASTENSYSMLEMGPRILWYFTDQYNWYATAEWNPYAKGEREKSRTTQDISGSSMGFGLGYRFRLGRLMGLGAGIHYHSLALDEQKINVTETDISDKLTNIMPMLELSILTR